MSQKSTLRQAIGAAVAERDKSKTPIDVENNISTNVENNNGSNVDETAEPIEFAGLNMRVPRKHRLHWSIEAKKQNTTLTAAVTQALNERFGEPQD